jgi:hypothetical protein
MSTYFKQAVGTDTGSHGHKLPVEAHQTEVLAGCLDGSRTRVLYHEGHWYIPSGGGVVDSRAPAPATVLSNPGYPDGNPKSLQGAKKYSLRYLPLSANIAVNQALEDGAKKYGPANWREKGVAISVYVDAALRHLNQFYDGKQDNAADSGAPNLGHAMACLAIIIDAMAEGSAIDDRPFPAKDTDALLKRPGV